MKEFNYLVEKARMIKTISGSGYNLRIKRYDRAADGVATEKN